MMAYTLIHIDFPQSGVAVVTLNRPDAANALNTQMALELKDFFASFSGNVTIIAGNGKHFCAGADLKERRGMDEAAWKTQHQAFRDARDAIIACPAPVIAAVHGAAFAGGLELALACDFIYCTDDARFALTEATLGIMPGMGGTQTLPRAIGARRAKEILFSGKPFSAKQAFEWGMVNKLCAAQDLREDALACASEIATSAPLSVKAIKKSVNFGLGQSLDAAFATELSHYNTLLSTKDRKEGINAWGEKRKPVFTGE